LFCIAAGLPGDHPSLAKHFVIVPLGMATGVLPLPAGALGALEGVMRSLYLDMAGSTQGVIVTFGYRAITLMLALIGFLYYLVSRREVSAAIHEAEEEQEEEVPVEQPSYEVKIAAMQSKA
jgi:uncharacterized membrane protein YbhN (UPF0104 family)